MTDLKLQQKSQMHVMGKQMYEHRIHKLTYLI